ESSIQSDVANVASRHVELSELLVVEPARRSRFGKRLPPDGLPLRGVGKGKVHGKAQSSLEGSIEDLIEIRRQNLRPLICLNTLQQIPVLNVGIAVVAVAHLAAIPEQCIGLIE